MSSGALKDYDSVKKRHLQEQLGIFDADLDDIADKLLPRLPGVLENLKLESHHFSGLNFPPELKMEFLASCSVLASAQARLDDTNHSGTWTTRHVMDPNDRNYHRPIGLKESL